MKGAIVSNQKPDARETVSYEKVADRCCLILPGDLLVEILQRLSVKSLLRFKSVSKNWLFLIIQPQFISNHLIYQQQKLNTSAAQINYLHCYNHVPHCRNNVRKFINNCCPSDHHRSGISLISKGDHTDRKNDPFSTSVLYDHGRSDVSIVGSTNGLVCLKFDHKSFCLWNPATRKLKFLPHPPEPDCVFGHEHNHTSYGFSYVPSSDCYKLVRVFALIEQGSYNNIAYVTCVQVLNMGRTWWRDVLCHGQWKEVLYRGQEFPFYISQSPIVVDCCMYWFGSNFRDKGSSKVMVWFDMAKEELVKKTLSNPFDDDFSSSNISYEHTVFEKNLAMIVSGDYIYEEERHELKMVHQVWIYEGESWKKQLTFGPLPIVDYPIGFWGDREIIVERDIYEECRSAYLYNPYSKEKINYAPCRETQCNFAFYPYMQSLVRI